MISMKNSLTLALTKLKARKIRNILTIVIASLMFAVLFFAVIVFEGFFAVSLPRFANETLSSKNMTVSIMYDATSLFKNGMVSEEQKQILDQYWNEDVLARQKRAKELKLPFDEKTVRKETKPYEAHEESNPNELWVKEDTPAAKRLVKERAIVEQETREQKLSEYLAKTQAIKMSRGYQLNGGSRQIFLKNQKEEYAFPTGKKESKKKLQDNERALTVDRLSLVPKEAYQAFLFKDHNWKAESKRVPIMLSIDKVESLLGLKKLAQNASPEEKSDRLQDIQQKSKDLIFSACYLNSVAMNQHNEALLYAKMTPVAQKEVKLAYAPINKTCTVPQVIKDTRSAEDKKIETNLAIYEHEFNGTDYLPETYEVVFQVVGMLPPDMDYGEGFVDTMLRMLAGSVNGENYVPMDMFMKLENRLDVQKMYTKSELVQKADDLEAINDARIFFFEYETPELVKNALELNFCASVNYGVFEGEMVPNEAESRCKEYQPEFFVSSFGSREADLISVKETFRNIILTVGMIFAVIAVIIMMGTVGRVISDSRRETAVFRAIGFKRIDIIRVYLIYGLILAGATAVLAFFLAFLGANILNMQFSNILTAKANWIYCVRNFDLKFTLVGLNGEMIGMIAVVILVIGLIATGLPLLRNIRRNPIRDMRDE